MSSIASESVIDSTRERAGGVHDLGGRTGFGRLPIGGPDDRAGRDSPFGRPWEARAFAVTQMAQVQAGFNTDAFRHGIEREDPARYLRLSYWAKWTRNAERMLVEGGILAPDAVAARLDGRKSTRPIARTTGARPEATRSYRADPDRPPRFDVGQTVRVGPTRADGGHTRLPRYVAGNVGQIVAAHGGWIYPDAHANGLGPNPQWVYSVDFAAADLWPDAGDHHVRVDLFEPYLEAL